MSFMDHREISQDQIAEIQTLFFLILDVIYASEYPITLETIAYQVQQPPTSKLAYVLSGLVSTGHIRVEIRDGIVNYQKPIVTHSALLPLPYHRMFGSF
jgi:hypothetical protein